MAAPGPGPNGSPQPHPYNSWESNSDPCTPSLYKSDCPAGSPGRALPATPRYGASTGGCAPPSHGTTVPRPRGPATYGGATPGADYSQSPAAATEPPAHGRNVASGGAASPLPYPSFLNPLAVPLGRARPPSRSTACLSPAASPSGTAAGESRWAAGHGQHSATQDDVGSAGRADQARPGGQPAAHAAQSAVGAQLAAAETTASSTRSVSCYPPVPRGAEGEPAAGRRGGGGPAGPRPAHPSGSTATRTPRPGHDGAGAAAHFSAPGTGTADPVRSPTTTTGGGGGAAPAAAAADLPPLPAPLPRSPSRPHLAVMGVPVLLPPGPYPAVPAPYLEAVMGLPMSAAAAAAAAPSGAVAPPAAGPAEQYPAAAHGADGGGPDGAADADAVATIAVRGAVRQRRRTGGGGTDGEETSGEEEEAGPTGLPPDVRRRLRVQLGRQRMKRVRTWKDLSYCLASPSPGHWQLATLLLLAALLGPFLFMAGQWEFMRPVNAAAGEPYAADSPATGPAALGVWLSFWRQSSRRTFSFAYLRAWGGRYGPDVAAGEWWRWATSLALHASTTHMVSNLALMLILSTYLESLYGWYVVLPVWLLAGLTGNLLSALFESPCTLLVGASGCVFGLLGAYVGDGLVNAESIPLLWARGLGMAAVVALLLALQMTDRRLREGGMAGGGGGGVSGASHVGGFAAGLLLALVALPDFKARRAAKVEELLAGAGLSEHAPPRASPAGRQLYSLWQRRPWLRPCLAAVAGLAGLVAWVGAPLYLYLHRFRRLACE